MIKVTESQMTSKMCIEPNNWMTTGELEVPGIYSHCNLSQADSDVFIDEIKKGRVVALHSII
jgi:hypothetical protein